MAPLAPLDTPMNVRSGKRKHFYGRPRATVNISTSLE